MARNFYTFVPSTTARASEVNNNFQWICDGDVVPNASGVLASNSYNLGTSSAKWLNRYSDKVTISTGTSFLMEK